MIRLATMFLIAHVLVGCGDEGSSSEAGTAATGGAASTTGGSPECGLQGPPTGSCSEGDECSFSDGGCTFDSYCKGGSWALVRTCNNQDSCPREGLMAGSSCADDGAECLYNEGGACVADLKCTGGVWVASGC
jgi:hypothetical protein